MGQQELPAGGFWSSLYKNKFSWKLKIFNFKSFLPKKNSWNACLTDHYTEALRRGLGNSSTLLKSMRLYSQMDCTTGSKSPILPIA